MTGCMQRAPVYIGSFLPPLEIWGEGPLSIYGSFLPPLEIWGEEPLQFIWRSTAGPYNLYGARPQGEELIDLARPPPPLSAMDMGRGTQPTIYINALGRGG